MRATLRATGHERVDERVDDHVDGPAAETGPAIARIAAWVAVGAAAVAALLATLGVALVGGGGGGEVVAGHLEVELVATGEVRQLSVGDEVPVEAELRATDGPATVRSAAGELSLAAGTVAEISERGIVTLRRGSLLVRASGAVQVVTGAVEVHGRGVWRVDVGAPSRLATYRGRLQAVDGVGSRQLARYEQVDLRGGGLDGSVAPLRYRDGDAWDRAELADAFATDELAAQLTTTLAAAHGSAPRSADFFAAFGGAGAPVLDRLDDLAARQRAERYGPPAGVLVGMVVADALVVEGGFLPGPAVSRVVELRRGGATWGLILLVHDLGPGALRAAADRALDQAAATPPTPLTDPGSDRPDGDRGERDAPTPGGAAPGGTASADGDGGSVPAGSDGSSGADPSPSSSPSPAPDPSPGPVPGAPPDPAPDDDPVGPVEELLGDPGGSIGDLLDGASELVGTLDGAVSSADGLLPRLGASLTGP
jgi:hypothetical protein